MNTHKGAETRAAYERRWMRAVGLKPSKAVKCIHGMLGVGCPHRTARQGHCPNWSGELFGLLFDHWAVYVTTTGEGKAIVSNPYMTDRDREHAASFAEEWNVRYAIGAVRTGRYARSAEIESGRPLDTTPVAFAFSQDVADRLVVDVPLLVSERLA